MKSRRLKRVPICATPQDPQWLKVIERLATACEESGNYVAAIEMRFECSTVRRKLLLADSYTERLSTGYYRVSVLVAGQVTGRFYIFRSRIHFKYWSIWSANDAYHSILLFKTLTEARQHCIHLTM